MRKEREFFKPKNEGVYLHVYNRTVTLGQLDFPFSKDEKHMLRYFAEKFLIKYNIELISLVVMGNHFHMLIYCPPNKMNPQEACLVYNKLHEKKLMKPIPEDDQRIQAVVENSNNCSEYMREVQGEFSKWFNKSRPYKRKGSLWEDRFKSQLIESDVYLWGCIKYLEMNPVRAGITQNPEEYPYSSFGLWNKSGSHPYQNHFFKHISKLANSKVSIEDLRELMTLEMKQMKLADAIANLEDVNKMEEAQQLRVTLLEELKKKSYTLNAEVIVFSKEDFLSGHVIGSKKFIKEKYRRWVRHKQTA
ncbi:MAG: transposase [Lentisphaeraceae bacterium]|nr:transposase [Lentisphaeraceae bacterium]